MQWGCGVMEGWGDAGGGSEQASQGNRDSLLIEANSGSSVQGRHRGPNQKCRAGRSTSGAPHREQP